MAGKKAKPRKTIKKLDLERLKPSDLLCPICRTILIEPVTLSCNHVFCKLCFEGSMENANLVCPLCRIRVSSWYRKAKKEGKLVDEKLWGAIQTQFPKEVHNRYQGIDNAMEEEVPVIVVSTPGEIRKEYEQQRQNDFEEQKRIRAAEEQASAVFLKRLKEEEEQQTKLEEEKLRLDAALARKLAEDLERPTTSKAYSKKPTGAKKPDNNKKYGPMDKFVKIDDVQSNQAALNRSEEKKSLYKGTRRISTTPNPTSDFATKEYTCHVLNAESTSRAPVDYLTLVNKSSYNKSSYSGGMPTVKRDVKVKSIVEDVEVEQRKSICKSSGYKSSGSGSDDTIDKEYNMYFKPIDTQRRYHVPGTLPLKVPCLREKGPPKNVIDIEAPSGKIINLQLGTVISAFASFSLVLQQNQRSLGSPTLGVIEKESSEHHVGPSNKLKRKLSEQDSPIKRKGRRQIYKRKIFQNIDSKEAVSSPFYGFENGSSRLASSSPCYGFGAMEIQKSNRERDTLRKLIHNKEERMIDEKSLISTKGLFFKTYSRHQNRRSNDVKTGEEETLKLQIVKRPKNGINMSEAIKNKLAELGSFVDRPRDEFNARMRIDVNRNIPKRTADNFDARGEDLGYSNAKLTLEARTSPNIFKRNEIKDMNRVNLRLRTGDRKKPESSSNASKPFVHVVADYTDNDWSKSDSGGSNGSDMSLLGLSVDSDDGSFKESSASSSPVNNRINGSWRSTKKTTTPRKAVNNVRKRAGNGNGTTEHDPLLLDRMSPTLRDTRKTRCDGTSSQSTNKIYQSKARTAAFTDKNSKITDRFSKVKISPTKPKNTIRKLKWTPAKTKLNNNLELDRASIHVNGGNNNNRKQSQEQSDFEMAKKLQEEFDSMRMPSRTRRGTKRQITLDEMLLG